MRETSAWTKRSPNSPSTAPAPCWDLGAGDGRYLDLLAPLLGAGARLVACRIQLPPGGPTHAPGRSRGGRPVGGGAVQAGGPRLVSFMEVIEHTRSPAENLDETLRVLRPRGRLALTHPHYPLKLHF